MLDEELDGDYDDYDSEHSTWDADANANAQQDAAAATGAQAAAPDSKQDQPFSLYLDERIDLDELRDKARAARPKMIVAGASETPREAVVAAFAAACDRAADHGLRVHLEFSRSRTPPDLLGASRVVAQAGRPNGGIMLDT